MSEEGDKTCPLCAEEMDLTDQQLKPCRCGYEICVWCWHHIMDMAEKEETDGCCPACRKPYDKERIVGTGANCERLVAEINMEKKHKSQKAKSKTSENRKQLSSVRVIQKNLVYIVGLPLNLADEDLLLRKEYFSQYGKVLKVSISRTSAGSIQQFPNNTCSVYITYGKEEEAVRCIQSVHGFILDGRPLRVCFGTTKYCHAWLRNMPCSNPDCLYLHEIGSQEDSFTKDEVISAYTRNRVQQITGYTNNTQRRAGNVLPPPADDYCNSNAPPVAKPVLKSSSNNPTSCTRVSPPSSSSGRSGALPPAASWGARASNANNPPDGAFASSNGPMKQKSEIVGGSQPLSTTVSSISKDKVSSSDGGKKLTSNEHTHCRQTTKRKDMPDTSKHHTGQNTQTVSTEVSPTSSGIAAVKSATQSTQSSDPSVVSNNGGDGHVLHNPTLSVNERPPIAGKSAISTADEKNKNLRSDLSSLNIENRLEDEHSGTMRPNGLCLDNFLSAGNQKLQLHDSEEFQEHSTLVTDKSSVSASDSAHLSSDICDWQSDAQAMVKQNPTSETEDDFDSQRLRDAIVVSQATMPASSPLHFLSHLRGPSLQHVDNAYGLDFASNAPLVNRIPESSVVSSASNGFLENFVNHASGHGNPLSLLLDGGQVNQVRKYKSVMPGVDAVPGADFGESSIISNILDLDSWDESLTSPNLAKLLGEADNQEGSIKLGGPWKGQNSNQSRFSFARQEESRNHLYNFESPLGNIGQLANSHTIGPGFVENRDLYMGRLSNGFGLSQVHIEQSDTLTNGNSIFPSTSRSQISAPRPPPGFAAPSRPPPPPGFNLHERNDQSFEMKSGNHLPEASALLRNTYPSLPVGNTSINSNDIEFLDPAILAVGEGRLPSSVNHSTVDMRSKYHVQNPSFENESRLLLMQRSLSPHQNYRYNDVRDNFSPVNNGFGFNTARHMEQSQQASNLSSFSQFSLQQERNTVMSNGHWDNWNEIPATNNSIPDLLRNDRLSYTKFGMASSGDMYNKGFRM